MKQYKKIGKYKTLKALNKSYLCVGDALKDLGYIENWGYYEDKRNFKIDIPKIVETEIFEKNGKYWLPIKINHYNTNIYDIRLVEMKKIKKVEK